MFTEFSQTYQAPFHPYCPYPAAKNRQAWESLPESLTKALIQNGESFLHFSYPELSATDYMDFTRTGNRERYEKRLFSKRIALNHLVLAECAEYKGRFLDDIVNGIFSICGETGWQLPAHNSYIRDTPQFSLPDISRPVVDLFSAETGAILSTVFYLLRDVLDDFSPAIRTAIWQNVDLRIFTPYLKEHFWWMGDGKSPLNNWTSWCTQNVLLAAAFLNPDAPADSGARMTAIFQKACQSLDYFLDGYGNDGCCDEGAQYYHHAGLTLFNAMEVLNGLTGGFFSPLFEQEKIRNIALYIQRVHIHDQYYVNFADCAPIAGRCNAREFLFGKRTGQPSLMTFAAKDYRRSENPLLMEEHNLFYRLQTVFAHQKMMDWDISLPVSYEDLYFPSTGLFIARDSSLFLAVKAGGNNDSHNHNDTGSFTVYKGGLPFFIDVGVETYTQKTFSSRRYEIWTMQSRFHNLPSFGDESGITASDAIPENVGGVIQKAGPQFRATGTSAHFDDSLCSISMDIAPAYGDSRIHTYQRTVSLYKEPDSRITVHDLYDGSICPVVLSLMTYEPPCIASLNGTEALITVGNLGTCRINGVSDITIEKIPIEDARLKGTWKHELYRCLVTMEGKEIFITIQ